MSNDGLYIGIPNGVVLCIDAPMHQGLLKARVYHGYHKGGLDVVSLEQILHIMGRLFDDLQHPRANILDRSFIEKDGYSRPVVRRKERVMSDNELLMKHGDIGTFIIRVQQRQNSTWQGRITWVEEDKTMNFRSILELIKLIESGIAASCPDQERDKDPSWED